MYNNREILAASTTGTTVATFVLLMIAASKIWPNLYPIMIGGLFIYALTSGIAVSHLRKIVEEEDSRQTGAEPKNMSTAARSETGPPQLTKTAEAVATTVKWPVETYVCSYDKNLGGYLVERNGEYVTVIPGQKIDEGVLGSHYVKLHGGVKNKVQLKEIPYPSTAGGDAKRSKAYEVQAND